MIMDYDAYSNQDWIEMKDVVSSEVRLLKSNYDLVIQIEGSLDQLTVQIFFSSSYYRIESLVFSDGVVWGYEEMVNRAE